MGAANRGRPGLVGSLVVGIAIALGVPYASFLLKWTRQPENEKLGESAPPAYAAVIDAGSTGTRIHIFRYRHSEGLCAQRPPYRLDLPERSHKTTPGIADVYISDVHANGGMHAKVDCQGSACLREQWPRMLDYFETMHKFLRHNVPEDALRDVRVKFRATAGLRTLPEAEQQNVLDVTRAILRTWHVAETSSGDASEEEVAQIMSGTEEGVFSWLLLNQLSGNFMPAATLAASRRVLAESDIQQSVLKSRRRASTALVEMGGMSAQVVLELPEDSFQELPVVRGEGSRRLGFEVGSLVEGKVVQDEGDPRFAAVTLCGKTNTLVAQSFDTLGRQMAMKLYIERSIRIAAENRHASGDPQGAPLEVQLACLHPGSTLSVPSSPSDRELLDLLVTPSFSISGESLWPSFSAEARKEFLRPGLSAVGTGDFETCLKEMSDFVTESAAEDALPCEAAEWLRESFSGNESVEEERPLLTATESFYYFQRYVLNSEKTTFSCQEFLDRAKVLCPLNRQEVAAAIDSDAAAEKTVSACLGLIFLSSFLEILLGLPRGRQMLTTNEVGVIGLNWPPGFAMSELSEFVK